MSISGIWLLVGLMRPLSYTHKRNLFSASLCDDFSDLTSPTSNHMHLAISVVYDTFYFFYPCMLILFNPSFFTVGYNLVYLSFKSMIKFFTPGIFLFKHGFFKNQKSKFNNQSDTCNCFILIKITVTSYHFALVHEYLNAIGIVQKIFV